MVLYLSPPESTMNRMATEQNVVQDFFRFGSNLLIGKDIGHTHSSLVVTPLGSGQENPSQLCVESE